MSQKVQLIIEMDENRQILISGPIQDKVLSYGLLAAAHDAIKDFHDNQKKPSLVPATPSDMLALRRNHQ